MKLAATTRRLVAGSTDSPAESALSAGISELDARSAWPEFSCFDMALNLTGLGFVAFTATVLR
ncbi:hypothetical protein GCM10008096_23820 [Zhihengliuella salsuginis]|uniref:Uncharacterized protein n=1 Tax=Zhihengliuella salsuginis TaxID=578222 RepID=A0ABQ3GJ98_9MICC|nr:hypothetical protein GCM10008096_23820 [Zhihengliuella salsuginis]